MTAPTQVADDAATHKLMLSLWLVICHKHALKIAMSDAHLPLQARMLELTTISLL